MCHFVTLVCLFVSFCYVRLFICVTSHITCSNEYYDVCSFNNLLMLCSSFNVENVNDILAVIVLGISFMIVSSIGKLITSG